MKRTQKKNDTANYSKIVNCKSPIQAKENTLRVKQTFDQYGNFIFPNDFSSDQLNVNSASLFYKN